MICTSCGNAVESFNDSVRSVELPFSLKLHRRTRVPLPTARPSHQCRR